MAYVNPDAADRIRRKHPLQYGFLRDGTIVYETGNDSNPEITERYNRCPNCEQWSPCDIRELLEGVLKEQAQEETKTDDFTGVTMTVLHDHSEHPLISIRCPEKPLSIEQINGALARLRRRFHLSLEDIPDPYLIPAKEGDK